MEQLWTILWSALGIIITGLISWATTVVVNWLNTKIKDKKMAQHATALFEIVMNSVKTISQTYVETIKKEGKFTKENQEKAFQMAIDLIKGQLTPELIKYITENFGDVEVYLRTQIESTIFNLKQ